MKWAALGFAGLALGVAGGAFGAHGLKQRLEPAAMDQWLTAVRYWLLASVALAVLGLVQQRGTDAGMAAPLIATGGVIFAGAVGGLALGGPRWLGAVAPVGGLSMIVGLVWTAWSLWRAGL